MPTSTSSLPRVCLGRSPIAAPFRSGLVFLLLASRIASAQPNFPDPSARRAAEKSLVVSGSMSPVFTLTGHLETLYSVRFSPDGRSLVTTSDDHTLILWDAATGRALRTFRGHDQTVFGVAFSPDGTQL